MTHPKNVDKKRERQHFFNFSMTIKQEKKGTIWSHRWLEIVDQEIYQVLRHSSTERQTTTDPEKMHPDSESSQG